ncbi:MAG: argininosuccinate lyase [Candidatus Ancaeobacter aquaticus]|nr:argininosuccinate lyase [Candidatus Ancaeobacter aquaticus]
MVKKLWAGRYKKDTHKDVEQFTQSVSYDKRLAQYDIIGSIAHAKMLAHVGVISKKESSTIQTALKKIASDISKGSFRFKAELEDVHMNVEAALIKKIGAVGGKLHTARSRNDQVSLDLRMYLRDEVDAIIDGITVLQKSLLELAQKYKKVIISGYTHMQHAQPVLFAHHMLAYVEMFERDKDRLSDCKKRINVLSLGACALAGTSIPIDRAFVAKELGFKSVSQNSIDTVSDRDFVIEFLQAASIMGMHFSRISEECILWASTEFDLIDIDESFCTGSSIMPQKKNPDIAELIRGKSGRLYGNLTSVLVMMKGLPLSYNRDMQEDKEPLFDSVDTVKAILGILSKMLSCITLKKQSKNVFSGDFSYATDVAEYLVKKSVPFRNAHEIVGNLVSYSIEKNIEMYDIPLKELQKHAPQFQRDIYKVMEIGNVVSSKRSSGGTANVNVERSMKIWKKKLF